MADTFTADKMAWLERVQDHPDLPQSAFAVAFALSRHMNRATGDAWPSQATIGGMAGVKARQVRNLIRALSDAGLIEVKSGGYQKPDRYRMVMPERQSIATLRPANDCHTAAPERQSVAVQSGNQLPPNPLNEPFEKRATALSLVGEGLSGSITQAFDAWWAVYPKKTKKLKAESLFARVLKRQLVSIDQLIAAADAYAKSEKVSRGYVMDPTTWLNDGCWDDDVTPAKIEPAKTEPTAAEMETIRAGRAARYRDTGVWRAEWGVTPDLRQSAIAEAGIGTVQSYLDPCAWDDKTRTLAPRNAFSGQVLQERLGEWMKRNGLSAGPAKAPNRPRAKTVGWV